MNTIEMKFGGTSVDGTEKLKNIANLVKNELQNNNSLKKFALILAH